jgi:hypothetical protein
VTNLNRVRWSDLVPNNPKVPIVDTLCDLSRRLLIRRTSTPSSARSVTSISWHRTTSRYQGLPIPRADRWNAHGFQRCPWGAFASCIARRSSLCAKGSRGHTPPSRSLTRFSSSRLISRRSAAVPIVPSTQTSPGCSGLVSPAPICLESSK